jgi:hypothetical protein
LTAFPLASVDFGINEVVLPSVSGNKLGLATCSILLVFRMSSSHQQQLLVWVTKVRISIW